MTDAHHPLSYLDGTEDRASSALAGQPRRAQRVALAASSAWATVLVDEALFADLRNYGLNVRTIDSVNTFRQALTEDIPALLREPADGGNGRRVDHASELDAGHVIGAARLALDWIEHTERLLSKSKELGDSLDNVATALMHLAAAVGLPYESAPTVAELFLLPHE